MDIDILTSGLKDFLKSFDPTLETCYNADDPSEWYTGNADDDMSNGYDAGYHAAQEQIMGIVKAAEAGR